MTWRGITAMRPGNGAGNGCFPRADAGGICAARRACSRAGCGDLQTSDLPHLPPFVCHASTGAGRRHSYDSGTARPQRCENHHDLYPCTEPWTIWGTKPRRPALPLCGLVMSSVGRTRLATRTTRPLDVPFDRQEPARLVCLYHVVRPLGWC